VTLDQVRAMVLEIGQTADDPEVAHAKEDALYQCFVLHVAQTTDDLALKRMAKEVLRTRALGFPRWTA